MDLIAMNKQLDTLTNKMRALAIENLKSRREEIFNRTRKLFDQPQSEEQSCVSNQNHYEEPLQVEKQKGTMEIELQQRPKQRKHKRKGKGHNTHNDYKTKRYWRRLLQVSDWLVSVPINLPQFYIGVRHNGCKCLMIMKYSSVELCDKGGALLCQLSTHAKQYNGTILQVYFNQKEKSIVISDMIIWKSNPMTGSQFEFRTAWLQSNLSLNTFQQNTDYTFHFMHYFPATLENLQHVYQYKAPYHKEGFVFVHKDSGYEHGLNPNVLVWKDPQVSEFYLEEKEQNKTSSRGVGYINKEGEVRSLENVKLFSMDKNTIQALHKFVKFTYTGIEIETIGEEDKVQVILSDLKVLQTTRNHYGPVDSLGKLYYKSSLKQGTVKYQQLLNSLSPKMAIE